MLLRRKIDRYLYEQKRHKEQGAKQKNAAPTSEKGGKDQATTVNKNQGGRMSDRPEADQNMKGKLHLVSGEWTSIPMWEIETGY